MIQKKYLIQYKKKTISFFQRNKKVIITMVIAMILGQVLFISTYSDVYAFGSVAVYISMGAIYKFKSKNTFFLCLGLLGVMFIEFLLSGPSIQTEKATVFLVLFWLVGIIQQWRE